jgi:hypothetical protein
MLGESRSATGQCDHDQNWLGCDAWGVIRPPVKWANLPLLPIWMLLAERAGCRSQASANREVAHSSPAQP